MTQDKPKLDRLFGQTIVRTSLDPVPRAMRTAPGIVVMNQRELDAIKANDGALWKELVAMIQEDDRARMRQEHS